MVAASRADDEAEATTPDGQASAPASGDGGESASTEPPLDVVFDVLRNRRRRLVLEALSERDGATTLGDLAEHIGGIENDKPPSALDSQERKRVYVGLYQSHLPKLDDAGAIDFDDDRGTVESGPHIDVFRRYLDRSTETTAPPYRYYAGVALASVLGPFVALFVGGTAGAVTLAGLIALVGVAGARATA